MRRSRMSLPPIWVFLLLYLLLGSSVHSTWAIIDTRRDRASEKGPLECGQQISSLTSKNGTFTSPNYPEPYPANVFCIYNFTGRGRERVQIVFTDFDLHLPHEPPRDCESVDAVMIFITVNGRRKRLDNFCGNKLPVQLMSNGPSMIVEFRSFHSSPEVKGFRAIYRFVTDFGLSSARQDKDSACEFVFKSEEKSNGTFISPNYPGYYPRETECHYTFKGKEKERVYITFSSFNVDGIPPCQSQTASDYVEFSNYKTVDRKLPRHCGHLKPKIIESDSDFFRVTFKSNDRFDATGFEAHYQFRKQVDAFTVKRISATSANNSLTNSSARIKAVLLTLLPTLLCVTYLIKL